MPSDNTFASFVKTEKMRLKLALYGTISQINPLNTKKHLKNI